MTYRLDPRLFVENGPTVTAARMPLANRSDAWRTLDADRRLAAIDQVLRPANDRGGPLPIAL